ncbi:tRNA lysidine(34) synthetase TilS [Clostridium amazonitimonense]|uniref:tRNA lysidine(34) synthetase TilS n=1 Tax=Clostridium amazonitimonense TaxID=1499689 RepID=UPI0005098C7D|nr:tRNA lysidine(34) synthetase TilS [Clostridium amazonitimonense]
MKKILEYISKHSMIDRGDKILVALSGGPDSVCLLHILYSLKQELNIEIYAAHINHQLRGHESDEDEVYVKNICKNLGIECFVKRYDINTIAKEKGISSEMAGREVRYDFFKDLKEKLNINKVALAHNANDQAETILMRIMRGTGIEGLTGIRPIRDDVYIRPILILSRGEIEEYCEINNLHPRIDKTNNEPIYARNKVRLELIPYIKENFNEDIINTLNRFSELMAKDSEYLDQLAYNKFNEHIEINSEESIVIHKEAFNEQDSIITRIIRLAIEKLEGTLNNVEMTHIYSIISLGKQGTGKRISLPRGVIAENIYDDVVIKKEVRQDTKCKELAFLINLESYSKEALKDGFSINIPELRICLGIKLLCKNDNKLNLNGKYNIKYFDFDKIKGNLSIRYRKEGDRFIPYGMRGSKKLKDIFIDSKVPREERDNIPLICFGEHIAWIVGYKVSDTFKVENKTKNILSITIERGVKN